jgi:hypothetical protein
MKLFAVVMVAVVLTSVCDVQAQAPEGIKVRGTWHVEVRNADGSVAHRSDFINRLVRPDVLADLLGGKRVSTGWSIWLDGDICAGNDGSVGACMINAPRAGFSSPAKNEFLTLTVSSDSKVVLEGSATAARDGVIDQVSTLVTLCESASCTTGGTRTLFTVKDKGVMAPVPVRAGQIVQVRVEISFS